MLLLTSFALAGPLRYGVALGPAVAGGASARGSWVSVGPQLTGDVGLRLGMVEGWAGLSLSGLLAPGGAGAVPASLLQADLGLGFGARAWSAGIFGGTGFPGGEFGLYGRATGPGPGWARRIGGEARLTWLAASESTMFSLLVRVEPGRERRHRAAPPRQHPDPFAEGEGTAIPAEPPPAEPAPPEAPPPEEPPPSEPTHHDEPY